MSLTHAALRNFLRKKKNPKIAAGYRSFFKTGRGEYGEGDIFLGITVPESRFIAKQFLELPYSDIAKSLRSPFHEERLIGLIILVERFKKSSAAEQRKIFNFYLKHRKQINNWDLVDVSAYHIVGGYLHQRDKKVLYRLAQSKRIWDRRIAIVSTFYLIRQNEHQDTLRISKILLNDSHDLIHKAVGWMLREVGKRDQAQLEHFLKTYGRIMPRTALRYAIERFRPQKRLFYLKGKF